MLTFEKVLEVFQAYLDDDPLYEVVQTSHGYTSVSYTHLTRREPFWWSAGKCSKGAHPNWERTESP